jgi:nickel transport protein
LKNERSRLAGRAYAGAALAAILTLYLLATSPPDAMAHGVELSYSAREGIEITAGYDSGGAMAGAQVTVYAPGKPSEPWMSGACDESGRFFFVPDTDLPGTWEVRVRQAGHGDIVRIEVERGEVAAGGTTGFTTAQKIAMAAAITWGFAGTALYFRRRTR